MITRESKIYIAGHRGMVGSACYRALKSAGYNSLIVQTSKDLDLRDQSAVNDFVKNEKPDAIIDAAARVGGIWANSKYPYQFLMDNMLIQNNLIRSAYENGVEKFIFLGSSCIYPKMAPQPLKESYLMSGSLESTNQWYAIAKISGVKLIEALRLQHELDFVSLMPTNLYGPNDNFHLETSHVLPAMIRKFHEAKKNGDSTVKLWGSGNPMREFLHVDDLALAVLHVLENTMDDHLYNVGTGKDLTIRELSEMIRHEVGHKGEVIWDSSKPDGTPRKVLDVNRLAAVGWTAQIELTEGLRSTYKWYLDNQEGLRESSI